MNFPASICIFSGREGGDEVLHGVTTNRKGDVSTGRAWRLHAPKGTNPLPDDTSPVTTTHWHGVHPANGSLLPGHVAVDGAGRPVTRRRQLPGPRRVPAGAVRPGER
jgi:hypothetical protein